MEWTGLNELREKYLSFFESKDTSFGQLSPGAQQR